MTGLHPAGAGLVGDAALRKLSCRGLQAGLHPRRGERRLHRQHQPGRRRDERRRKTGAHADARAVGVRGACRALAAAVDGGQDRVQAGPAQVDAVAAGRGNRQFGADIGIADLGADMAQPGHADRARAIGRRLGGQAGRVARRRHHHRADGIGLRNGLALALAAGAAAAQAQVDHPRGRGVERQAGHCQTSRPADAGHDVGGVAEALAQHAHRQHAQVPARTGHADAVVGGRADDAGHLRAVPRTGADFAVGEGGGGTVGGRDPVARVAGVAVAPVAVVRDRSIADHVVAGQQLAGQVGVVEAHAGVEHGHHDRRAQARVPGRNGIDRGDGLAFRCAQVPLAHGRATGAAEAAGKARVVRQRTAEHPTVGFGVLDLRIARDAGGQRLRRAAVGLNQLRTLAERRQAAQAHAEPRTERCGASFEHGLGGQALAAAAHRMLAQRRGVAFELDDHAFAVGCGHGGLRPRWRHPVAHGDGQHRHAVMQDFHPQSLGKAASPRRCGMRNAWCEQGQRVH